MYLCIFCNYYNEKKENYIRHVKTKKHLDIVKKILDVPHNNYICGICKYKTDKKSSYFCHINLCLIKNFNNTFQTDYKEEITQLKDDLNKYQMHYIDEPDAVSNCRTCETETNGQTYCSEDCKNYDLE